MKLKTEYFSTGNVVKTKEGYMLIVTKVTTNYKKEDYIEWVSFGSSNVSGGTKVKSGLESRTCFCIENNDGEYDSECEDCKGTGSYKIMVAGMEEATIVGRNVKEYIIKSLTKNFDF
jgi:hypothetical protein